MPSSPARSGESAAARTAVPSEVRWRHHQSPSTTTGTATTTAVSSPPNGTPPTVAGPGTARLKAVTGPRWLARSGRKPFATDRICSSPIVATASTRRGEDSSRWITVAWTVAPTAAAATSPRPTATQTSTCQPGTATSTSDAATPPRAAWATLTTLAAR